MNGVLCCAITDARLQPGSSTTPKLRSRSTHEQHAAAFGLAQLERIDELVAKKRQIFSWYAELPLTPELRWAEPADIFHTSGWSPSSSAPGAA